METDNIILKAINALDEKMDKNFTKISEDINLIKKTIKVIPQMQEDIKILQGNVKELQEDVKTLKNDVKELQEDMKTLKDEVVPCMQKDILDLKIEVRQLSRTVAKMEYEHGRKLEALFDAFGIDSERIDSLEMKVKSCKTHLDKHDDIIYYLKSKIQE